MALVLSLLGDALSVVARRAARSGRGAALRVTPMEADGPATERRRLFLAGVERSYRQGEAMLDILRGAELAVWPGQRWRWWRRQVPASRRCCTSQACSNSRMPARSMSMAADVTTDDAERTRIRRSEIGFVYQAHHLLPEFSALENVVLPQMIRGLRASEATARAAELLTYLG